MRESEDIDRKEIVIRMIEKYERMVIFHTYQLNKYKKELEELENDDG